LREAHAVKMNEADGAFRERMRELAKRGGAATKRLAARQPGYYRAIGQRGGGASAASRKARIAAEPDGSATNEPAIAMAAPSRAQPPPRPPLSPYAALRAKLGQARPNAYPIRKPTWEAMTEANVAREIARIRRQNPENWDEPFDELG